MNQKHAVRPFTLLALLLTAATIAPARAGEARDGNVGVETVLRFDLPVADLDRSLAFFTDVLTFAIVETGHLPSEELASSPGLPGAAAARYAGLKLGDEAIRLIDYEPAGKPMPADSRSNDLWFQHIAIIVSDMDAAHARLQQHGVTAASRNGPQRLPDWNQAAAGIRAFYFRDPDGHYLEVLQFPAGKGDPKWHKAASTGAAPPLFLGIDHTAIVVRDTEASLRFYRDTLGLKVAGGSVNYGPEQENLNNVDGARLRITTLRAAAGPAVEFLEYLEPRNGRPYPGDARAGDILHWQTTLVVEDPIATADDLRRRGVRIVAGESSTEPVAGSFVIRDPDGHALRIKGH